MNDAAESREADGLMEKKPDTKRKRAAVVGKKKPVKKKSRTKLAERRRLVWVIYSNTQKEEDRFPYEKKKEAEERIEHLRSKSKKLYWLQAVKEVLGAAQAGPLSPDVYDENYVAEIEEEVEEEIELAEEEEEEEEEEDDDDDDDE